MIAEKIKYQRKRHRISQEKLAEMLDFSRSSINSWERNASIPSMNHIVNMSFIFNVSIEYFLDSSSSLDEIDLSFLDPKQEKATNDLIECYEPHNNT